MMNFARPEFLFALLLLPLVFLFSLWTGRRKQEAIARLGEFALLQKLSASVNQRARQWKNIFWFFALLLLIIALARPQWGSEVQIIEQKGLQIMVALDVSQSMLAEDIQPNRLERAKLEINELMNELGGDEIGLVLFSGASFIQFPLTSDYATARTFLESASTGIISRPGTEMGKAIQTAINGFDPKRSSQKIILLITDGEDHAADTVEIARQAANQDILIYAIGFGTQRGEPIPEFDSQGNRAGFKKDQQGQIVLTRLDEAILQQITRIGGGKYYHASADSSEINRLITDMSFLQREDQSKQFETIGIERFQGFVFVALILLITIELIPDRGNRNKKVGKS